MALATFEWNYNNKFKTLGFKGAAKARNNWPNVH